MKRCLALLMVLCLLLAGILTGCGDDGSDKGFRFPLAQEPAQLDPQAPQDAAGLTVIASLFEGLTRLDSEGNAVPGAADWTVSADGLTYTFTLRESYWSTISVRGEKTDWDEPTRVTADDFVFGFQRAVMPETASPLAQQLDGIVNARDIREGHKTANTLGVHAEGEYTLVITLVQRDEHFPTRLAAAPFLPCNRAFFQYTAGRYGLEKAYLLTNGPFTLAAWNHGESLLLRRHEQYHAAQDILPQAVRYVIGTADPVEALNTGTMDAELLPADRLQEATAAGIRLVGLRDTVRSVYFNTRDTALSNADVRRALRDSVEWESIYAYLEELGEQPAAGYVAPDATVNGSELYRSDANDARLQTRAAQAQESLGAGLRALYPEAKSPALPTLRVLAADGEQSANLARYLIQSWQKNLNLSCQLELVSESALTARMNAGNYQVAIAAVTAQGLSGAENLQVYGTGAAGNLTGYTSAAFDTALAAALTGGRAELTAAEMRLREDCPTVPLSFVTRYYGVAAGDEGVLVRPFNGGAYGAAFDFRQALKKG